ncbi:MAG: phosphatidylglycerophosphatase A [Bacteroidales bacterium]|nr:phosphatidylglycerophosphatase A [Bacteroidales bacterium]
MERLHKIIASGLGTGFAPFAPGTAGSILGILLFYAGNYFLINFGVKAEHILLLNLLVIILVLLIGVYSISIVHKTWKHDAPKIVIDEIVGVWIAVYAMPFEWQYYLYALILFRFFDISKPLFIRRLDAMPGDWSVMLDDVLAGIYSLIVIQVLFYLEII